MNPLPTGFRVRLRPDARRLAHGQMLVGGSPLAALWISRQGADALRERDGQTELSVTTPGTAHLADRLLATNLAEPVIDAAPDPTVGSELTVVIPVRDRPEQLDRALAALAPLRCVVVDDASRNRPAVKAVATRHGAELLSLPTNRGPAGARNAGLARVSTAYVAFVDSDVTVSADALLRLAAHFADPSVALVGPLIRGASASSRPRWFERYDEHSSSLTLGTRPASVRPRAAVAWLPGACLVGRTQMLRDGSVQGFDSSMRAGEDVDLVWRLVGQGLRVRYDPSVVARHDTRGSLGTWAGRKFVYGTSGADLARRHGDNSAPAELSPVLAAAAAALLARHRAAAPISAAAVVWGTRAVRNSLRPVRGRNTLALRLSLRGMGWALRQESALLLRHWWPATLLFAIGSRGVRRMVFSALAVDVVVAATSERGSTNLGAVLVARRVDDLAYGAGLWVGSARVRTPQALLPRWLRTSHRDPRDVG